MSRVEQFTALIERDGDGYVALCPELDVASQGSSVEEARGNLKEALELFFEAASESEISERVRSEVYVTRLDSTCHAERSEGPTDCPPPDQSVGPSLRSG